MPNPTTVPDDHAPDTYGQAQWRALGTYVQLVVAGERHLGAARGIAVRLLDQVDRACSRFRPDSDLVRANRNAGSWTRVDPLLAAAVTVAVRAAEETDGQVDPTLGHSLVAAGYDRDYDELRRRGEGPAAVPVPAVADAWRWIRVDPEGAVLVPAGTALDLGATCKAFAADLIAARIGGETGAGCVLSLGGDVAVGVPPSGPAGDDDLVPWPVTVAETPQDPPDARVTLLTGGLATSTVLARRWHRGGRLVHHLLDPATGRSVEPRWRTVSVTAHSCLAANTASTAAVVIGSRAAGWLADRGLAARLVDAEGAVTYVGAWAEETA
ncbi:MAG TPA: FAD:protein FMN transferase [Kineosporiaceae bacterium]